MSREPKVRSASASGTASPLASRSAMISPASRWIPSKASAQW